MVQRVQPVRGMNDILPDMSPIWQHVEEVARGILASYGYTEIRLPLIERLELFARSIGTETDIVKKEMYTFTDSNGDQLALRPEGTAGCVRAGISNGLFQGQVHRLYYTGAMFRHERPQKGRYRQFHQIGVEAFGVATPDIDVEQILMARRLLQELGIEEVSLQLNSLGKPSERQVYRQKLAQFLEARRSFLCAECQHRIQRNPLRVLDCKVPSCANTVTEAPQMTDYLGEVSRHHFERVQALLEEAGIPFTCNPRLVRGLDYYTDTVYEWLSDQLGAQATVVAGGRYDGLVEEIGGPATPAVGFALGLERLISLLAPDWVTSEPTTVFIAPLGEACESAAMRLAEALRDHKLRVWLHCGGGSLKSQLKKADRLGTRFALILGEQEREGGQVLVRDLHTGEQTPIAHNDITEFLHARTG